MKVTVEEAKQEVFKRMKKLNFHPNVLSDFNEGTINKSELIGILYWLNDEEIKAVREFEAENESIVYHVIHQFTNIGELYSFLYVKLDDEEWEMDDDGLEQNEALAYVWNKTTPQFSELGYIGIRPQIGGLVRTW